MQDEFDTLGVKVSSIDVSGSKIEVEYEASDADEYDDQLISDWAIIMGVASQFGYDKIIIINTITGEPVVKLTTSKQNVDDFASGSINETVFWENVEIKQVE